MYILQYLAALRRRLTLNGPRHSVRAAVIEGLVAQPDDEDLNRTERLRQLDERINALKKEDAPEPKTVAHAAGGAELAWRMVIDLVAGIGIGFGIGYGLDWLFGTIPIFLVVFTLFGFAAGVQSMMRTARAMAAEQNAAQDSDGQPPAQDDESGPAPATEKDEARGD